MFLLEARSIHTGTYSLFHQKPKIRIRYLLCINFQTTDYEYVKKIRLLSELVFQVLFPFHKKVLIKESIFYALQTKHQRSTRFHVSFYVLL